jgi:ribosomal protein S18 acetylase RimI-like enzyme
MVQGRSRRIKPAGRTPDQAANGFPAASQRVMAYPMSTGASLEIPSPAGLLHLRPEREEDRDFRYRLFCDSRQPEFALALPPPVYQQVMAHQFQAQTVSYRNSFPQARFDIIELDGASIGRIVVDRPGTMIHIVDQAIVPHLRGRGIGTAIMRAIMDDATAAGLPVQLEVDSENDPSFRLYRRLGFVAIETAQFYLRLEWRATAASA